MRAFFRLSVSVFLGLALLGVSQNAQAATVFDQTATLGFIPISIQSHSFSAPAGSQATATFDKTGIITGFVFLNGNLLASPSDFAAAGPGGTFVKNITALQASNTISWALVGIPFRSVHITIDTVGAPNTPPTIDGTPDTSVLEDDLYSFTPAANDPDVGDILTFSITNQPSWAFFDTGTGELSGIPTNEDVGLYTGIVICVTDNESPPVCLPAFDIEVINENDAPTIAGTPPPQAPRDSLYSFTPMADDDDLIHGDAISFSVENLPSWAEFDEMTGTLFGTPAFGDIGVYPGITITVTDLLGEFAVLGPFSIEVTNIPEAEATIGAAGGCVEVTNPNSPIFNAEICIPAGALSSDVLIQIFARSVPIPNPDPSLLAAGMVVEFEPSGLSFAIPATISIPYFPGITATGDLSLYVQETLLDPPMQISPITVDDANKLLIADIISTFSSFGPFITAPPVIATERASVSSSEAQGNGFSGLPFDIEWNRGHSASPDGRYIAFHSAASNLLGVGNDTNAQWDIFVRDRSMGGVTVRVSVSSSGGQSNGTSRDPSVSVDGRSVSFRSFATNLAAGDTDNTSDILVHDRDMDGDAIFDETGFIRTVLVSKSSSGVKGNGSSYNASISADGRFVVFLSDATNLVTNDTNGATDVFVHDRDCDEVVPGGPCKSVTFTDPDSFDEAALGRFRTIRVSESDAGAQGTGSDNTNSTPSLSADGRYVTYSTAFTNIAGADPLPWEDIFVRDRDVSGDGVLDQLGDTATIRVGGIGSSFNPVLSPTGSYVVFQSRASLLGSDMNGAEDVYLWDRNGPLVLMSVASDGSLGNRSSRSPWISGNDGRFVVFQSLSSNFSPDGDTNTTWDVFVHDRDADGDTIFDEAGVGNTATLPVSISYPSGNQSNGQNLRPVITGDGKAVIFASDATNLVANDTNARTDVFVAGNPFLPARLVFGTPPTTPVNQNATWPNFTVRIENSFGALMTNANSPVTVTLDSPPSTGAFSGTLTHNAVNGIATFTGLSYDTAETVQFDVTSPGLVGIDDVQVVVQALPGSPWARVSAGTSHTCAIKFDGRLFCWGRGNEGQLGQGSFSDSLIPVQEITAATDWVEVSAGFFHTCALKSDGRLFCWGDNSRGQLGNNSQTNSSVPVQEFTSASDWAEVSAGHVTCSVKADGRLYCWGIGIVFSSLIPIQETVDSDWSRVSVGFRHLCAIKIDRRLFCWGDGNYGQLGDGTTSGSLTPLQEFSAATDWSRVSVGTNHTCALKTSGEAYCWGRGAEGQLGNNSISNSLIPVREFTNANDWVEISAGGDHSCSTKADGRLFCWGYNINGQLGNNLASNSPVPVQEFLTDVDWAGVVTGELHTCALKFDGRLFCWGENRYGQLANGQRDSSTIPVQEFFSATDWVGIGTGWRHSCGMKADGTVFCWGEGSHQQLGSNSVANTFSPVQEFSTATDWAQLSVGQYSTCSIKTDGRLFCWGTNLPFASAIPVQEPTGASDWAQVSLGEGSHLCAIKADGRLFCWGGGGFGQLGNNSVFDSFSPAQEFTGATDWAQVSAGQLHTCAVKTDGRLFCWGSNLFGELGDGSLINSSVPVQEFTASNNWTGVSTGASYTCGVKADGRLYCWGYNGFGQLGNGSNSNSSIPTQEFFAANDWSSISAGDNHACAIKVDGRLFCWGLGEFGELSGSAFPSLSISIPFQEISAASDWGQVSAGYRHTCAVKTDGRTFCWGWDFYGQLGDGEFPRLIWPTP